MRFPKTLYISQAPEETGQEFLAYPELDCPEQQFMHGEEIGIYQLIQTKTVHVARTVTLK